MSFEKFVHLFLFASSLVFSDCSCFVLCVFLPLCSLCFFFSGDLAHNPTARPVSECWIQLEATRMGDCKANTVVATKEEHPVEDVPLEEEQCKACRSTVARASYLSQDGPDIRFATEDLCRKKILERAE